jgi:hypothetical protein
MNVTRILVEIYHYHHSNLWGKTGKLVALLTVQLNGTTDVIH